MAQLELTIEPTEVATALDVRQVSVRERMSEPFELSLLAVSREHDLDIDAVIGRRASLRAEIGSAAASQSHRYFHGVCVAAEHAGIAREGLSSFELVIAPRIGLLGHRRNYRAFQQQTALQMVASILGEWGVPHVIRCQLNAYPTLDMRVQYGETDLAFVERLLASHGISYAFEHDEVASVVVLDDQPHTRAPRERSLPCIQSGGLDVGEGVSSVRLRREMRSGRYRIRAFDFRNPQRADHAGEAADDIDTADGAPLERYHYLASSFFTSGHTTAVSTPSADDRGVVRSDERFGQQLARIGLERKAGERRVVRFSTTALDVTAGMVVKLTGHARTQLNDAKLLLRETVLELTSRAEMVASAVAVLADQPYRPPLRERPRAHGLESAIVVGPAGQEIHTDEFGRVRVQFHWDREGGSDEHSSCWVRVSQGWAGAGFGMVALPRIGQEVLVGFLGGDPDAPVVVGRLFNGTNPLPHRLPESMAVSTWMSRSTPGGEGFNELSFHDDIGQERVYVRAERDLEKLVRHDEREHTVHDRIIGVGGELRKTVHGDEIESSRRRSVVHVHEQALRRVRGVEQHLGESETRRTVKADHHVATIGRRLELVKGDAHLKVTGELRERSDGKRSLVAGTDLHVQVGQNFAVSSPGTHITGERFVVDASDGITLKVGGAFVSISSDVIAISAPMVLINSGGTAGDAVPCSAAAAEEASEADVPEDEGVAAASSAQVQDDPPAP